MDISSNVEFDDVSQIDFANAAVKRIIAFDERYTEALLTLTDEELATTQQSIPMQEASPNPFLWLITASL